MNQERLMGVLLAPVFSEKSSRLGEKSKKIVFKVLKDANKQEIAAAVKLMLDVDAVSVATINVKGKKKKSGKIVGKRKDWKKAYITLSQDSDMSFSDITDVKEFSRASD